MDAEWHSVIFEALGRPGRVFFYRLSAGDNAATSRLLAVKYP